MIQVLRLFYIASFLQLHLATFLSSNFVFNAEIMFNINIKCEL